MNGGAEVGPALEVVQVRHCYGPATVLDNVSLRAAPGEWLVLLGESGSGKSTLLRIIAGLERPTSGQIFLLGEDRSTCPACNRPVAWMSQSAGCYEHLSVAENLAIAQRLIPRNVQAAGIDIGVWRDELIDRLGLARLLARKPSAISGGERQRTAIARALLSMRPILLLDEPLAHLNESMREEIGGQLREWTRRLGMTVLVVTHDSLEAAQLADRMALLVAGRIEQIDAPKLVVEKPASEKAAALLARARRFGR
ncbi:MAG: ABC transporter ATP-binding protein [Planctomycetota bacterium]|jgi:ABC-type Fe3+/spermidine/putrescine transport system ATPase subunit